MIKKYISVLFAILCISTTDAQIIRDITSHKQKVFVATDNGIFILSDDGKNMAPMSNGLPSVKFDKISSNNSIVAAITFDGLLYLSNDDGESWSKKFYCCGSRDIAFHQSNIYVEKPWNYISQMTRGIHGSRWISRI
jgi:ligand-binding sensor domain-containing protein